MSQVTKRPGRAPGGMLSARGSSIKLVKGTSVCWADFVEWTSDPIMVKRPIIKVWVEKWGGREIRIDMVTGAAVSGVNAWYIDLDDKRRLLHERETGEPLPMPRRRDMLPIQKKKKLRPLFHVHKSDEEAQRIREKHDHRSKTPKQGRIRATDDAGRMEEWKRRWKVDSST